LRTKANFFVDSIGNYFNRGVATASGFHSRHRRFDCAAAARHRRLDRPAVTATTVWPIRLQPLTATAATAATAMHSRRHNRGHNREHNRGHNRGHNREHTRHTHNSDESIRCNFTSESIPCLK
jgi:hypothetical protein